MTEAWRRIVRGARRACRFEKADVQRDGALRIGASTRHVRTLAGAALPMLVALLWAWPLSAQGWIEPTVDRADPGVVKVRTNVSVRVTDRIALIEVEEWFRNNGGVRFGESDYVYPLPGEAVFSNVSLFQGDQELGGEMLNAEEARRIYEEIVRRRKDPALIELVGHGMVRARVFPINPGETRKITMRYSQVLSRAGDALHFRYAAGGRFAGVLAPGSERGQGVQRLAEPAPLDFTLSAEAGDRFGEAFSPTHAVRTTRERGRLIVRPAQRLHGDFALFLPFADRPVGLTVVTHRTDGEDGYFMLTLSPRAVDESRLPRDVTAVVDVSGSMSGEKIEQARRALIQLLGTLDRNDRVRLISFSSGVRSWRPDWTQATPDALESAKDWVDRLGAEGGTNISGALAETFRLPSPDGRLPIVLFMTDGLPSIGERDPEQIARAVEQSAGRARIFAFGVGHDVNTHLLDRLGAAGRGSAQYVQPGEDVEQAIGALATKVSHPVLSELRIAGEPVRIDDLVPSTLPDLFAGEDLVLFGRYRAARTTQGRITIEGVRNGRTERYQIRSTFPEHEDANDYIPRLWAARRLGVLEREIRLHGPNDEIVEEIRNLALRYGLLSEYTSYLVQEPEMLMAGALRLEQRVMNDIAQNAARQSGQGAVVAAEASRRAREVRSAADLDAAQKLAAAPTVGRDARDDANSRAVAGRIFSLRSGVWTDAFHRNGVRVVDIEPFSPAYFALLEALPELRPYWSSFRDVIVAGREVSLRLGEDGRGRLEAAELKRLVLEFRTG